MYTYKVAGPQVAIEKEIITQSCAKIGYGEDSDGTIPTGGSMSNYMALIMARDRAEPKIRTHRFNPDFGHVHIPRVTLFKR